MTGNLDTKVYQWYEAGLTNNGSLEMQTQIDQDRVDGTIALWLATRFKE